MWDLTVKVPITLLEFYSNCIGYSIRLIKRIRCILISMNIFKIPFLVNFDSVSGDFSKT